MLRIINKSNRPVFLTKYSIGVGKSIDIDESEYGFISSNVAILENRNIISIVTVKDNKTVKQEVASLTSETPKKGRRKNKKEIES